MIRSLALALCLASTIPACKSHEAKAAGDDDHALCVQVFTRSRACTASYIPALVDARARHDVPPGIADAVKADRAGVIQEALTEWETDSTDAAISATCDRLVAQQPDSEAAAARACLAQADCDAFTACIMPVIEKHFSK